MRRATLLTTVLLMVCAGHLAVAGDAVVIKRLASGLVCGANDDERRVCFQTADIPITGEGTCVFAGRRKACTWYGFSFEYELSKERVKLQCTWSSSDRASVGNPSEQIAADVNTGTYEIELARTEKSFFNPQYSVLPERMAEAGKVTRIKQACSYEGAKLFEVAFTLRYPER